MQILTVGKNPNEKRYSQRLLSWIHLNEGMSGWSIASARTVLYIRTPPHRLACVIGYCVSAPRASNNPFTEVWMEFSVLNQSQHALAPSAPI